MSDNEITRLLRSLPIVKAPDTLEARLGHAINRREQHVPHMLGSLPMVPAHEDFDARLTQAIRERRRRVVPPLDGVSAGASIWGRWLSGAVVVGGLLLGFLHISEFDATPVADSDRPAIEQRIGTRSTTAMPSVATSRSGSIAPAVAPIVTERDSRVVENEALPTSASTVERQNDRPASTRGFVSTRHTAFPSQPAQRTRFPRYVAPALDMSGYQPSIAVPTSLPATYTHRVLQPAQFQPEPAATGSAFREDDGNSSQMDSRGDTLPR